MVGSEKQKYMKTSGLNGGHGTMADIRRRSWPRTVVGSWFGIENGTKNRSAFSTLAIETDEIASDIHSHPELLTAFPMTATEDAR